MTQRIWTVVAGASGFLSVGAAAFGSHGLNELDGKDRTHRKELWKTGNQMHMIHSLALLGIPLIRNPYGHIAGTAFTLGILGFSGSMYAKAYYGELPIPQEISKYSPQAGGSLLGIGWLLFCIFPK